MEAAVREAAAKGDEEAVRQYIRRHVDVNATDAQGNGALHLAAKEGHSGVVLILLRAGADVNAQNVLGETPLLLAARKGDLESVRAALKFDADTTIADNNGRTPLFVAMRENHSAVAAELLDKEVDNRPPADKGTVDKQATEQRFREAAEAGDVRAVREMLAASTVDIDAVDDQNHSSLYRATFYGRTSVVDVLLKEGANPDLPDRSGKTPLHVAASENNRQIVALLLKYVRSVDVRDTNGGTPIFSAAESGSSRTLKPFLDASANVNLPNNKEETPLWMAAANGHGGFIRRLIEETQQLNIPLALDAVDAVRERSPLHLAAEHGHIHVAALLLDAGAGSDIRDSSGYTPLFLAAEVGRARMVSYLLDRGVSINAVNHQWETALYVSTSKGNIAVTQVLLNRNADMEAADADGRTPLMRAAQEGHVAVLVKLLEAGAEIETVNDIGETPLMGASLQGYQHTVAVLIHHNANFETVRNDGKTALHLATREGHVGVVNILLSAAKVKLENTKQEHIMTFSLHLAADTQGETALHLAARFRQVSIMKLLLDYDTVFHNTGSTIYNQLIHQQNIFGWTAMHGAVDRAHRGAVNLLLDHEADVNAADIYGHTPIHLAARGMGHIILKDLLHAKTAQMGAVNIEGRTPLHFASACIRPSSVSILLENGADVSAADVFKQQPLDLLGRTEACNPEQATTDGLCNDAVRRPDMCPIALGDEKEWMETEILLKMAAGHQNRTQSCYPSCVDVPNGASLVRMQPASRTASTDSIRIPVYGVIIPALALVLLMAAAAWIFLKRKQREVDVRHSFGFSSRRFKHKQEQAELEKLELGIPYSQPLTRRNTFDAMHSILNNPVDLPEESKTSASITSDSESSCRWSDATDDLEKSATDTVKNTSGGSSESSEKQNRQDINHSCKFQNQDDDGDRLDAGRCRSVQWPLKLPLGTMAVWGTSPFSSESPKRRPSAPSP